MKINLFIITFLIVSTSIKSQILSNNDVLKNTIVSKLNKKDYKGIYYLADEKFKSDVTEEQLTNLLQGTYKFGKILKSETISTDTSKVTSYRLYCKDKSLQLSLKSHKSI